MNDEKIAFQQLNSFHSANQNRSPDIHSTRTQQDFSRFGNRTRSRGENLNSKHFQSPSVKTDSKKHVSSPVRTNKEKASVPFILPPPKIVGSQVIRKKVKVSSNEHEEKSTELISSTEIKDTDENQIENDSADALEKPSNIQQTVHPTDHEVLLAEETNGFEESISTDLKNNNESLSGATGLNENEDKIFEEPISEEPASFSEEPSFSHNETSLSKEESRSITEKSSSPDEFSSVQEESSSSTDESSSMVEEEFSSPDESSSIVEEESSSPYESTSMYEEDLSLPDESLTMVEEETSSLDESSSVQEESSSTEESSPIHEESASSMEDFSSMQEESSSSTEESSSMLEESSSSSDESSAMIEEEFSTPDDSLSMVEEESSSLDEASSVQEESSTTEESSSMVEEDVSLPDESSSVQEESSSSSEESSSLPDESSSIQEELSSSLDEPTSTDEKPSSSIKKEASTIQEESLREKVTSMLEDSSSLQECWEEESLEKADKKKKYQNKFQFNEPLPIVKLPVLLAAINIDVDIFDSYDLLMPITKIRKIDWTCHSLKVHAVLPSNTVFLKGILVADIEYVNENQTNSFHTYKLQVPWKKITNIDWLHRPVIPENNQVEYTFQSNDCEEISNQREYEEQLAHPIQHDMRSLNFVWSEEVSTNNDTLKLFIQGRAKLCINLLQQQYIDLHSI